MAWHEVLASPLHRPLALTVLWLVSAEIGISVSWVVQGRNKTWMQMNFIHRP